MRVLLLLVALFNTAVMAQSQPSPRVASAGAAATELMLELGLSQHLVAIDGSSARPPELQHLPDIGYVRALNAEGVLALKPDLLLANDVVGPTVVLTQLEHFGVKVVQLPQAKDIAGLQQQVQQVGQLFAIDVSAQQQRLAALQQQLQQQALGKKAVFLLFFDDNKPLLVGDAGSAASDFMRLIGVENLAAQQSGLKPASAEALLSWQPEVIFISSPAPLTEPQWQQRFAVLRQLDAPTYYVAPQALVTGVSFSTVTEALRLQQLLQP